MSRPRCAKARRSRACRSPSADGEPRPRAKSRHLARASQPRTGFAGSLGRDERPPRVTCSAGEKGRRWCRATAGLSKSPGDTAPAGGREGCRHDNSRAASPAASRCLAHGRPRPASAPPPRDRRSPKGSWRGEGRRRPPAALVRGASRGEDAPLPPRSAVSGRLRGRVSLRGAVSLVLGGGGDDGANAWVISGRAARQASPGLARPFVAAN